jgi:hypothetical protein
VIPIVAYSWCWFLVQEKAPYVAGAAVRKGQYEQAMAAYKVRRLLDKIAAVKEKYS